MKDDPLEPAAAFLYLSLTVVFDKSDWAAQYQNIQKAWHQWGVLAKVLKRTGTKVQAWLMLYKVMVQTVLLYGR